MCRSGREGVRHSRRICSDGAGPRRAHCRRYRGLQPAAGPRARRRSDEMYQVVTDACHEAGIELSSWGAEDHGDGCLVVVSAAVGKTRLLGQVARLSERLADHNMGRPRRSGCVCRSTPVRSSRPAGVTWAAHCRCPSSLGSPQLRTAQQLSGHRPGRRRHRHLLPRGGRGRCAWRRPVHLPARPGRSKRPERTCVGLLPRPQPSSAATR